VPRLFFAGNLIPLMVIACVALVTIGVVRWTVKYDNIVNDLMIARVEIAAAQTLDISAVKDSDFRPVLDPYFIYFRARNAVLRGYFEVADPNNSDLAILAVRVRNNFALYVNGDLAGPAPGVLGARPTYHGMLPRLIRIPPALLVKGANRIDVLAARNLDLVVSRQFYAGPFERLSPAYAHSIAIQFWIPLFATISAFLVLAFTIAVTPLIDQRSLLVAVALTLSFFVLRQCYFLIVDITITDLQRTLLGFLFSTGLIASSLALVNEWSGPLRRVRILAIALGIAAWAILLGVYAGFDYYDATWFGIWVERTMGIVCLPVITWRLLEIMRGGSRSKILEAAIMLLGVSLAVADFIVIEAASNANTDALSQFSSIALVAAIALALAQRAVALYRQARLNNQTLSYRIAEKEQELSANFARLEDEVRQSALFAERARIMRDMHDGIGSQLLGLLLQARAGKLVGDALTSGLQASLDDLHLVVDSLDQVEGSLEEALGAFRGRIEPKCEAANVRVDWTIGDLSGTNNFGPAKVLQIYRILQEACMNALRHGRPRTIRIASAPDSLNPGRISISVCDDGKGFDPKAAHGSGRGLANMRKRAASIDGVLELVSAPGGTQLTLRLPV
jgi:signal transduction histidine kinase